ncbi:MAG: AAA family ATPase [Gammaproteobacteria bacterium]
MAVSPTPPDADGERKQITVLFGDVAGYTSRSVLLDPEELAEEIHVFQSICARIAGAHCGHISHFLGDGILMLFGHPFASEFDPQHAVRAGLEMVAEVARGKHLHGRAPPGIRVGIATGLVMVGGGGRGEMIFGETPNLAARLQQLARPNTVVASPRTRRLARGVFAFRDLGARRVRGFAQPLRAWRALHELAFCTPAAHGETRFIGRGGELRHLREQREQALRGRARIVHVSGAPGIGKSRLMRAFETTSRMPGIGLRILCAPGFRARAFKPIIDNAQRSRAHLARTMLDEAARFGAREHALLGELLGLPVLPGSDGAGKHRPLDALASLVINLSRRRPVSLLVEDLHRADAPTLAALGELVTRARGERLFAVFTSRAGFTAPWPQAAMSELRLGDLSAAESAQLVAAVFGARAPQKQTLHALLRAGGGVPLFLEEMSRHALAHECANPHSRDSPRAKAQPGRVQEPPAPGYLGGMVTAPAIPDTLQNFLTARLDQLGKVKHFAQLAAAAGEDFCYSLLSRIAAQNHIEAGAGMDALFETGLLARLPHQCKERYREDRYAFRHSIFREAASRALPEKTRQRYHLQFSETISRDQNRRAAALKRAAIK